MGPIPIKRTEKLVKADLKARAKFELSPLGMQTTLKNVAINAISRIDPLEVIGLMGLTYTVFNLIQGTQELFDAFYGGLSAIGEAPLSNPFLSFFTGVFQTLLQDWMKPEDIKAIQHDKDWLLWIESFGIAYLLLKTASGGEDLVSKVAGLMGMRVV